MWKWLARIPRTEALAVGISLAVGVLLLTVKFVAFFLTRSAAIFSDAVESIANVMGAGMALYALSVAHRPADEEHPYGHGKIEFLSAMFEGSLVFLAAVFILFRTIDAIWHGELVNDQQLGAGLWLVAAALVVNGGVGLVLDPHRPQAGLDDARGRWQAPDERRADERRGADRSGPRQGDRLASLRSDHGALDRSLHRLAGDHVCCGAPPQV